MAIIQKILTRQNLERSILAAILQGEWLESHEE